MEKLHDGREEFYAQIPALVYGDEVYGVQIQVWKKLLKLRDKKYTFTQKHILLLFTTSYDSTPDKNDFIYNQQKGSSGVITK